MAQNCALGILKWRKHLELGSQNGVGPYKSGHTGAKCLYCLKIYKNAKPTDLEDHITNQCPKVTANIKTTYLRIVIQRIQDFDNDGLTSQSNTQSATTTITASTSTSNKRRRAQSSVTSFYESSSIDVVKEERCTRALTRYFICCGIPFSTIEHPFCIDFIKSFCLGYNLPGRNFLSTTLINTELAYVQVALEEDLANEKNLTLELAYVQVALEEDLANEKNLTLGTLSADQ
ncbi:hypothetical protein Glove_253g35 [Diversispora epigaea]|uniref:BED-type domain-containing protein n=1 Tax=Diversispora epigaea TaxID=1348612 RepID=A0A397I823_9GLOM|nr:hypothetical protein Glove_253g35 [Diversispora epigaea]